MTFNRGRRVLNETILPTGKANESPFAQPGASGNSRRAEQLTAL